MQDVPRTRPGVVTVPAVLSGVATGRTDRGDRAGGEGGPPRLGETTVPRRFLVSKATGVGVPGSTWLSLSNRDISKLQARCCGRWRPARVCFRPVTQAARGPVSLVAPRPPPPAAAASHTSGDAAQCAPSPPGADHLPRPPICAPNVPCHRANSTALTAGRGCRHELAICVPDLSTAEWRHHLYVPHIYDSCQVIRSKGYILACQLLNSTRARRRRQGVI